MFTSVDDGTSVLRSAEESTAAHDYPSALGLLARHWPMLSRTHGAELRALITSIPEPEWQNDAAILAALGASYGSEAAPGRAAAGPWFETAEMVARSSTPALMPDILLHHASALRSLGSLDDARLRVSSASVVLAGDLDVAPSLRITLRARCAAQLGMIQLHRGSYEAAERELTLATAIESELSTAELVECLAGLALTLTFTGDYARAEASLALARHAAKGTSLLRSQFGGAAVIAEALIAVRRLRVAEAVPVIPELHASARYEEWRPLALYALSAIAFIEGRHIEGLDISRRASDCARGWQGRTAALPLSGGMRTRFLTHLGELDSALGSAELVETSENHEHCRARYLAGIRLRRADPQGCLDELEACERIAENHSSRTLLEVLLLTAAARYELGNVSQGEVSFDRALYLSATTGMRSPFATLPRAILRRMLSRAKDRNQPDAVHGILDELRAEGDSAPQHSLEALSDRELVITRHLSLDKTVGQIAAELFISVNTVKTHVRSIYRKLEATSRKEALRRVKDLGLDLNITPG